jgi:hypothetical protein
MDFSFLKAQHELHQMFTSNQLTSIDLWNQALILRFESFM